MTTYERKAEALRQQGEPYASALVVRCESPTSAKPGAKGIITRDGKITGWIGGGCAQPIVIEEALSSLKDGVPRLVRITPEANAPTVPGLKTYPMVCHSGGTMDIFIEPVLPRPRLLILGRSPVARTLATLAAALRYEVRVYAPRAAAEDFPGVDSLSPSLDLGGLTRAQGSFVVVCTQGEDDEGGVRQALACGASYVALVASPKKWKAVSAFLESGGLSKADLARVRVPAGVEINAREPEEIAVSILAEIVSVRRSAASTEPLAASDSGAEEAPGATTGVLGGKATDPICKMTVEIENAAYVSEHEGRNFYFCCAGCQRKFEGNPAGYLA